MTPGARASFILIKIGSPLPAATRASKQPPARPSQPASRCLRLNRPAPAQPSASACAQAGFAVRRGDTFPGLGPGWLRIAVRDRATNDRFVAALARVLDAISKETHEPLHGDQPERALPYPDDQRAAVYRVIAERRDVRQGFLPDPVPDDVLARLLAAAHQAPSVGFSQPWDFIVITDRAQRERVAALARRNRDQYAAGLPAARARAFGALKVESILDTPVNLAVTCDPTRGGRHTLGRHSQPETAGFSSVLAISNLWLAARAEGLGVGWVSFFGPRDLAAELGLPAHLEVVAYLCLGYVREFGSEARARRHRLGPAPPGVLGRARGGVRPPRAAGRTHRCACWTRWWPRSARSMTRPWRRPGNARTG